jgi:hypothetical protein
MDGARPEKETFRAQSAVSCGEKQTMPIIDRSTSGLIVMLAGVMSLIVPASVAAMPDVLDTIFKILQLRPAEGQLNPFTATRVFRDPADIALDAAAILCVVGLILYLVPKGVRQPMHVTVEPQAEPHHPASSVSEYFQETTEKLANLGFSQELDFTVPELPHQGFFRYMSLRDGSHTALISEVIPGAKGKTPNIGFKKIQFIEFQTILAGDITINTSNNPLENYLSQPPNQFVKRAPQLTEPRDLFDAHRRHVKAVRTHERGAVVTQRLDEFFARFPSEWEKINEYQVSVGLLKRDPSRSQYIATPRVLVNALLMGFTEDFGGLSGLAIPIMVAIFMGALVWSMPTILSLTGLCQIPVLAAEFEMCAIGCLALTVGLASRVGGLVWAGLCYAPSAVLFVAGPVGVFVPFLMAVVSGGLGEKLAFSRMWKSWRDVNLLSPEIYIVALALVMAALWL